MSVGDGRCRHVRRQNGGNSRYWRAIRSPWICRTRRIEVGRLGLREIHQHDMRHLAASLLIAQGLPLTQVSARLGHGSPAIAAAIYSHALKGHDGAAAAVVEAVARAAGAGDLSGALVLEHEPGIAADESLVNFKLPACPKLSLPRAGILVAGSDCLRWNRHDHVTPQLTIISNIFHNASSGSSPRNRTWNVS